MKYIVLIDTKEQGPVAEDILVKWAESGRITADTQIRNAILNKWRKASEYNFLKSAFSKKELDNNTTNENIKKQQEKALAKKTLEEIEDEEEIYDKLKKYTSYKNPFLPDPAPASLRFLATVFDYALVGFTAFCFLILMVYFVTANSLNINFAFYIFFFFSFTLLLVYYAACLGVFAQTFGMWFWGILIVKNGNEGKPVYLYRAFWFTVLMLALGIIAPFFMYILGKRRSLHDMLCGTQIARISARVK